MTHAAAIVDFMSIINEKKNIHYNNRNDNNIL